ncbi:hypothetical protein LPB142_07465 [Rhodobacter xanthinilyticus]|uniref:Uncharacterized protein n=1 Tax=Rhodobacter xanthinilyticus TaxID=1850250 RepID=A0A1D9MBH8_9RHOB|nr:hypothetical protein [Rhodobacter xanthinilyticus]AOZ69181.1 hypothetical protein LPB142_07465 [Rhodobacter xanthinilyticus]
MQNPSLDRSEIALLEVLAELGADRKPVERGALQVAARGQGIEVARPVNRLKGLGFIEEIDFQPGFFRRLIGARATLLVGLTASGLALVRPAAAEAALAAAEEFVPEPEPTPEPAPEPVPEPEAAPEIVEEPAAPVAPAPAKPKKPRRAAAEKPMPLDAYTDTLGGLPEAAPAVFAVDPGQIEAIRELLGSLGMELTWAGEELLTSRLGAGDRPGEAASQVVLFAFAHAIRHDQTAEASALALGLKDYAVGVMQEIERLRDGGEIAEARFEADMRALWDLVGEPEGRAARAEALLLDPIGGAAPPALLPEELREAEEG